MVSAADGKPLGDQPALAFQHEVVDEQPPRNPWTKLAGDFNGDGRPDILGDHHGGPPHPVELWLSQVPNRIGTGPLRVPQTNPRSSNIKEWNLANPTNLVRLNGKSLCDDAGPFLGLGVSYFQALRHAKYDRARLDRNLALFAAKGFNYVRILSMVSWDGLEIAPVTFTNRAGRVVAAWPDYWSQFRDLLDVVAQHGLRAEVTLFADAQYVMPSKAARQKHLDGILANIAGRESYLLHLEVANEAWQNGFPGAQGIADLRAFTQYLADRTRVLVAITSNDDTSDHGISALYRSSAADLATVHFSRDTRTSEGGWLAVRDAYRAGNLPGVPPVSSNEPIGPGSSVSSESDPIKLCAAAVFAYLSNLPAYVFHSSAGVYARVRFEDTPGIDAFQFIRRILPPDLASWTRNDGLEPSAPFTVFSDGQPNRYWPAARGATNGCLRNIGSAKGGEFMCFPLGILAGGVTLEARRPLHFQVIHPLTGVVATNVTLNGGDRFMLPPGPGAYLLKGAVLPNRPAQPPGAKGDDDERVVGAETQSAASLGPPIPSWFPRAPPLPPPKGNVIRVATVDALLAAVDRVRPGDTILLADGHYRLSRVLVLQQKNDIALRSASGDPTRVILSGRGWDSQAEGNDLIHIGRCEGVTIADLTFTDCRSYGIKVEAENAPRDIHIYNCHFRDIGVRAIKGSAGQDPNVRAVKGSVRHCSFENTKVPPADWLFGGDYIAAIDMMALEDWTFSDNIFRNIKGRNGGGRAAVFIWVRSRRVVVERNLMINCDRGVAFGNPGQSTANLAGEQNAYVADGIIRNNFIAGGADCGIELWHADRIKVFHNTIWRPEQNWSRGLRVGTGTAHSEIVNNLVHGDIRLEGGEAQLRSNLAGRLDGYFVDPGTGNLALTPTATRAIDQGVPLTEVTNDIRGRLRSNLPEVGACEFDPRVNQ